MSKMVKDLIVSELKSRYANLDSALWIEFIGADGLITNQFRRTLRSRNMQLEIVRNALFRRAFSQGPLSRLANDLTGPSALVTSRDESVIEISKLLEEWMPKIAGLKLRGAVLEGEYIDSARVGQLSKMPTKRDLQGQIAAAALAPGARLAAAINSGGGRIAGCIKALIEKLEKAAPPAAEAPALEAAPAASAAAMETTEAPPAAAATDATAS